MIMTEGPAPDTSENIALEDTWSVPSGRLNGPDLTFRVMPAKRLIKKAIPKSVRKFNSIPREATISTTSLTPHR